MKSQNEDRLLFKGIARSQEFSLLKISIHFPNSAPNNKKITTTNLLWQSLPPAWHCQLLDLVTEQRNPSGISSSRSQQPSRCTLNRKATASQQLRLASFRKQPRGELSRCTSIHLQSAPFSPHAALAFATVRRKRHCTQCQRPQGALTNFEFQLKISSIPPSPLKWLKERKLFPRNPTTAST